MPHDTQPTYLTGLSVCYALKLATACTRSSCLDWLVAYRKARPSRNSLAVRARPCARERTAVRQPSARVMFIRSFESPYRGN